MFISPFLYNNHSDYLGCVENKIQIYLRRQRFAASKDIPKNVSQLRGAAAWPLRVRAQSHRPSAARGQGLCVGCAWAPPSAPTAQAGSAQGLRRVGPHGSPHHESDGTASPFPTVPWPVRSRAVVGVCPCSQVHAQSPVTGPST